MERNASTERYSSQFITRRLILDAAHELSRTLPESEVTVKHICERANMSRTMFYRYFSKRVDIINWLLEECFNAGVNQIGIKYSWFEGHLITTRKNEPYRDYFHWSIQSKDRLDIASHFYEIRRSALIDTLRKRGISLSEKLAFQIEACIGAEFKATEKWFEGDYDVSAKTMSGYLASSVPTELFNLLNKPLTPSFGKE